MIKTGQEAGKVDLTGEGQHRGMLFHTSGCELNLKNLRYIVSLNIRLLRPFRLKLLQKAEWL